MYKIKMKADELRKMAANQSTGWNYKERRREKSYDTLVRQ